jgi:hypothetical protein
MQAIGHKTIERSQLCQVISRQQLRVVNVELRDQTTEGGDAITFSDAKYRRIKTIGPTFQGSNRISNGAPGIIMSMKLDANALVALEAESY